MFSPKIAETIQELLDISVPIYFIEQIPSFDQAKNLQGFVGWDIEEISPYHNSEGIAYANDQLATKFELQLSVYGRTISVRTGIEKTILDIVQPIVSGKRKHLIGRQLTKAFVRHIIWVSTTEFPVLKTAQSTPELSASVMVLNCSFSLVE